MELRISLRKSKHHHALDCVGLGVLDQTRIDFLREFNSQKKTKSHLSIRQSMLPGLLAYPPLVPDAAPFSKSNETYRAMYTVSSSLTTAWLITSISNTICSRHQSRYHAPSCMRFHRITPLICGLKTFII